MGMGFERVKRKGPYLEPLFDLGYFCLESGAFVANHEGEREWGVDKVEGGDQSVFNSPRLARDSADEHLFSHS